MQHLNDSDLWFSSPIMPSSDGEWESMRHRIGKTMNKVADPRSETSRDPHRESSRLGL
jgi:hypothetical protein